MCVGQDSHSVTDQTQGDWNGVVGRMQLLARPAAYVKNVQVYPDVDKKRIRVELVTAGKNERHEVTLSCGLNGADSRLLKKESIVGDTL